MHLETATAPGSAHVNPGQPGKINNQDVAAIRQSQKNRVVVLCDGCGSQPYSGTGADIGANLIAGIIFQELEEGTPLAKLNWNRLTAGVISALRQEVRLFASGSSVQAFEQAVMERFLFTAMVLAIQDDLAVVASFGDGVVIIDDEVIVLEPPLLNAPPYLGYRLISNTAYGTAEFKTHLAFSIVKKVKLPDLRKSLIIGTDGLRDLLEEDLHHPALVQPKQLQRWINSQTTEKFAKGRFIAGRCPDDVTVAIFRTAESQAYLLEERREIATLKQETGRLKAIIEEFACKCKREHTYFEEALGTIEDLEKQLAELQQKAEPFRLVAKETAALQATLQSLKDDLPPEPKSIPAPPSIELGSPEPKGILAAVGSFLKGLTGSTSVTVRLHEPEIIDIADLVPDDSPPLRRIIGVNRRRYQEVMGIETLSEYEYDLLLRSDYGLALTPNEGRELGRLLKSLPKRVIPISRGGARRSMEGNSERGGNGKGVRKKCLKS